MKNIFILYFVLILTPLYAQSVTGRWKTIDDETGKAISIVEIYEEGGKIYGRVADILNPANKRRLCTNCGGADKNKAILGMTVIKGLKKDGNEYNGGKILDPKSGKLYKCYITLESPDKLKVRGYIGISLLGRTQYWVRMKGN